MPYKEVPVESARQIARQCEKDVVVIVAWDEASGHFHTTTYGRFPRWKVAAARLGEIVTTAAGGEVGLAVTFEDFRDRTQAEWAAELETLHARIRELEARQQPALKETDEAQRP